MKRVLVFCSTGLLLFGLVASSQAKPRIYKWVKDKRVSSDETLTKTQYSRVLSTSESQAEKIIKGVMTENLFLSLAQYHVTKHQQDAETTSDSVLPEEIVGQQEIDLIDEDYRFILEVKTKRYGNRTRVTAKAWPVYRLRDLEAEDARDEGTTESTVDVKIRADQDSAVSLGPIVVAPILGLPSDYGIEPLPDAAERAGEIVKAFMYFLDRRMKDMKQDVGSREPQPVQKLEAAETGEEAAPPEGQKTPGVEVDIKVKTKK